MVREILKRGALPVFLLAALLALASCGAASTSTSAPTAAQGTEPPTQAPTEAPPTIEPTAPPSDANPYPAEMPSAVRGMAVYEANCTSCHGAAGDGSGLPGAADFTDATFMRGKEPADFFVSIRDGVEGTAMPAWGGQLEDMEVWDTLYYAWSFATSPDETAEGETLFADNCTSCHGAVGDGSGLSGAANFTDEQFMANRTPARFFESITQGVDGTSMLAWGETFTADQVWALVNYVWTFAYESPARTTGEPTTGPAIEPSPEASLPQEPDPVVGAQLWAQKPCSGCHGAQAMGDIGPRLAGTVLQFDEVLLRVRAGKGDMPAFSETEVSDLELQHIYAWLESIAPPTPTPGPTDTPEPDAPTPTPRAALPPSGHLMAFWEHVNWVKVHSDFAKDASPTIEALHDRVRQARDEGNGALQEADLAIAEIPDQQTQATIRQVKGYVNEILQHANAALNTNNLDAARAEAAKMVEISRLDAWPSATLAVKQAGFTGSVQVRVRDPSGNPLTGALVTALTAPSPAAGITDGNGRVTINDLAAVRVMQVKAYQDELVYHEVHVTVPVGGRADADIVLPGPSV
ncbi:MAG: c-type cytochrome, partial [Anaerolineae bacterium]